MTKLTPSRDAKIVIVGASILGLSTALHLASRGYQNITLLDHCQTPSPYRGSSSSSTTEPYYTPIYYTPSYHALSTAAISTWNEWNESLWSANHPLPPPPGFTPEDRLWINNGFLTLYGNRGGISGKKKKEEEEEEGGIPEAAVRTVRYLERRGRKLALLLADDDDHAASAHSRMFCIDPFRLQDRGIRKTNPAVLDTLGGMALVGRAWEFAMGRAGQMGHTVLRLVFDETAGHVGEVVYGGDGGGSGGERVVRGVKTRDGKMHEADFLVWACEPGDVTMQLLPAQPLRAPAAGSETTCTETVLQIQISREGDLWDRFAPDNFPSWTYIPSSSDPGYILFGFPRDEQGCLRIGWRGPTVDKEGSILDDGSGAGSDVGRIREFLTEYLPELLEEEEGLDITQVPISRVSHHDRAVVDRIPGVRNVILALDTKASRQNIMFLPAIGGSVVNIIEGGEPAVKGWRWSSSSSIRSAHPTRVDDGLHKAKL